ncbi:MAG: hypothetical protein R3B49_00675 [Phycisphaerales bacterium]
MPADRPRLAIVSTYNELCGIAAYTHRLERYLDEAFDVEVLKLDQTLLRSDLPRRMKLAERHIDELCARLRECPHANIQYEPGTLGPTAGIAFRRFRKLARASRSLSVTFHTFERAEGLPLVRILKDTLRLRPGRVAETIRDWWRMRVIGNKVFRLLKKLQRERHVALIVHTKREATTLTLDLDFQNVFDHPLAFLRDEDVAEARAEATRADFPVLDHLAPDTKIIGVFGFVAPYKGTLTAVRAMRYLPEDYHLAIFGAIHPAEIRRKIDLNPYLAQILDEITGIEVPRLDEEGRPVPSATPSGDLEGLDKLAVDRLTKARSDISHRVHFMGPLDDDQFARGMCLCDAVALPYLEVGQTSSGPISIAVELGCRIAAARNHAFAQFARYHPERFDFFDIGNHVELATRILHPYTRPRRTPYGYRTNRDVYLRAHGLDPFAGADRASGRAVEPKPAAAPVPAG